MHGREWDQLRMCKQIVFRLFGLLLPDYSAVVLAFLLSIFFLCPLATGQGLDTPNRHVFKQGFVL